MWNNSRRDEKLAWVAPMGRRGAWVGRYSASKLNTESVGHVEKKGGLLLEELRGWIEFCRGQSFGMGKANGFRFVFST